VDPRLHNALVIAALVVSWSALGFYVVLLVRWRKPELDRRTFLLSAPLWLLAPRRFFREDRAGFALKGLLLWFVLSIVMGALIERAQVWMIE
jgi:hypothetical protein